MPEDKRDSLQPTALASRFLKWASMRSELLPFGWGNVTKLAMAYFFATLYFYIPVGTL